MLWKRVLSALVFVPFLIISMYVGGIWWFLVDLLIIFLALKEYRDILLLKSIELPLLLLCGLSVILVWLQSFAKGSLSGLALLLATVALIIWILRTKQSFANFAFGLVGLILISWSLSFLVNLRFITDNWWLVLLAFIIPWLTDTGAYCVGVLFGKHKMAPVISPKKSWEGAIGGVATCLISLLIYNALVLHFSWLFIIALAIVGSVLGQIGDLLESWLKRWVNIKDSGKSIPGHGGILDRFDSMLLVAPVVYYMLLIYQSILI